MTNVAIYLLAGTILAAPAMAQTTAPASPTQPTTNMPAPRQGAPAQQGMTQGATQQGTMAQPAPQQANIQYITQNRPDLWRASRLEGVNVYNDRNERVGEINEVLVNQQGQVEAVVIGVGGFLGIGQRDVAVPFNALRWENEPARTAAVPGTAPATTGAVGTATGAGGTAPGGATGAGTMAGTAAAPAGTAGAAGTTAGQVTTTTTGTTTTTAAAPATTGAMRDRGWAETRGDAMRDYPERAILANATKDLLERAPEFRYAR